MSTSSAPQVLLYNPTGKTVQWWQAYQPLLPLTGATQSWYAAVASGLADQLAALAGRSVVVNGMGSALVAYGEAGIDPATGGSFNGEPATVADLVRGGYVWIDACGLPMTLRLFREPIVGVSGFDYDPSYSGANGSGIGQALGAMGVSVADLPQSPYPQQSAPPGTRLQVYGAPTGTTYPYPTALTVNQSIQHLPGNVWLGGSSLRSAPIGYTATGLVPHWAYSLVGVRAGSGLYVYATQDGGRGVSAADVVTFVRSLVAGESPIAPPSQTTPPPVQPGISGQVATIVGIVGGAAVVGLLLYAAGSFAERYVLAKAGGSHVQIFTGGGGGQAA